MIGPQFNSTNEDLCARRKNILKNKSPNTCPGEDGLLYGIMAGLPTTHHFLATLYSKTDKSSIAMDISSNCCMVLAHKAGDPSIPSNFRMLAMTSCLAKPCHEIKAKRMATFMVENGDIDTSLQKAYLEGITGCKEHIKVLQEVIQDAKARKKFISNITKFQKKKQHTLSTYTTT